MFGAAAPFWYVALRRVKKLMNTRFLPLISLFASFSFVVMMFNLPLPGGTSGHAIGLGVATVVLGPWASILAISIALVIQALFFGDGGVTAIGANCFNMAIVGSLVAYGVYRLLARRAGMCSQRRAIAAAAAGYAAINASALFAAVEFGLQPLLFHNAAGAPLYCPYPLSVSIPAMMLGHLTFAGLAELAITGGVVAYLQRTDASLLLRTAPDAPDRDSIQPAAGRSAPTLRTLWLALAVLLVLTPLGILVAGSAWGEWAAKDFANPGMQQRIASASSGRLPPAHAPSGLERLSSIWTAPVSQYAPRFIKSPQFGYLVSAMVGVGVIISLLVLVNWLIPNMPGNRDRESPPAPAGGKFRRGFVEQTRSILHAAVEYTLQAEELSHAPGWLQKVEPRVKLFGIGCLIVAAVSSHQLLPLAALLGAAVWIALVSQVPLSLLLKNVWLPALSFSGIVALPALFLTAGAAVYRVPLAGWQITQPGLVTASLLLLRVETCATFSALLIFTTEWTRVLRAFRFFRVPVTAVVILQMSYRYVFLLLRTALEMFESRQSRLIGTLESSDRRRVASASVGVLLSKTFQLSGEVHDAMRARGYQGEIYLLDETAIALRDWLYLAGFAGLGAGMVWVGR